MVDLFCGSGALGVEALSRGAASATFVDLSPGCARRRADEPRRGGAGGRARDTRAGVAARVAPVRDGTGVRPRAVRPPLRLRGLAGPARAPAGRGRRDGVGAHRSCSPRAGWSRESAGTAVRSSPWHIATGQAREGRAVPGLLRPLPQRAPRDRRAGQPPLRRGGGGRVAQPPEERGPLRPRGAPGDAGRGGGAPAVGADRLGLDAAGQRRRATSVPRRSCGGCAPCRTSRPRCRWPR